MSNETPRPNFSNHYDLLVVGGGINGAAIANTAALNGLKTALIEKGDFASGTSSKSTKLIHGGLRYLENLEFGLVREALRERAIQLHSAPHLVKPLKFVLPVYDTDRRPFWMIRLGVTFYDALSGKFLIKKHQTIAREAILEQIPSLKEKGLVGAVSYYDAQMDDARLCLENVLMAKAQGADVANYVEAKEFIKDNNKVIGLKAWDLLEKKFIEIKAKKVVCALGPWTAQKSVRTTKGVHIVYRGRIAKDALIFPTFQDNRVLFAIPWMGNSLIGTTDTDFSGTPDQAKVEEADIDYLFKELTRVFPDQDFEHKNIITTFAGLRPLVQSHKSGAPSTVSRKHVIEENKEGVMSVMGGKYTTYRKIAEDVIERILKQKPKDTTKIYPLYGFIKDESPPVISSDDVDPRVVKFLIDFYGTRYRDVLELINNDATLKQPICSCSSIIRAQVVYAIKNEMACTADDIIWRRLPLAYLDCPTKHCHTEVKKFFAHL